MADQQVLKASVLFHSENQHVFACIVHHLFWPHVCFLHAYMFPVRVSGQFCSESHLGTLCLQLHEEEMEPSSPGAWIVFVHQDA